MTYLEFHLAFLLPPIAALLLVRRVGGRADDARGVILLLVLIALAYTTPWDNYLVREGIWSYGADRVVGTIGWVPVEEYLFFALQPILAGLWYYEMRRFDRPDAGSLRRHTVHAVVAWWFTVALAGAVLLAWDATRYLGLILVWAAPVLGVQWILGRTRFGRRRRSLAVGILGPTLWLAVADRIAIGAGIWSIAPGTSTGVLILGLPVEEAVFFLLTNMLVVQGIVLLERITVPGGERGVTGRAPREAPARSRP